MSDHKRSKIINNLCRVVVFDVPKPANMPFEERYSSLLAIPADHPYMISKRQKRKTFHIYHLIFDKQLDISTSNVMQDPKTVVQNHGTCDGRWRRGNHVASPQFDFYSRPL